MKWDPKRIVNPSSRSLASQLLGVRARNLRLVISGLALLISTTFAGRSLAGNPSITDASPGKSSASAADTASTGAQSETGGVRSTLRDLLRSWLPGTDADEDNRGGETAEAEGGTPEALEGNVVAPPEVLSKEELAHAQPWHPTNFDNQKGALGWTPKTFEVTDAFRTRVGFWKDIYAKYSTDQGVIHDTIYINIIYSTMDFSSVSRDNSKSAAQKARTRESMIKEKKKEIIARLQRLQGHKTADGLSGEDLRIWKLYEHIQDPEKFVEAADKSRVRFQLGQRDKFVLGIFYSGRYLRAMEKIFRDDGLPMELTRLPFVESSFNVNARSRVGASGVWQFMRRTAKPYMKVNRDVDERNDPIKSTLASSRVLKQNYMMLESWPLALTGYNHGPYGVRGIIAKTHTRDLGEIIAKYSSRTFGFASENFYACFLAALEIEKNAHKYFGDVKWSNEVESTELKVPANLPYRTLVDLFDGDSIFVELLNPQFSSRVRSGRSPIPKGSFVRVPPARAQIAQMALNGKLSGVKLVAALKQMPALVASVGPSAPLAVSTANGASAGSGMSAAIRTKVEQTGQAAQAVLPILTLVPSVGSKQAAEAQATPKVAAVENKNNLDTKNAKPELGTGGFAQPTTADATVDGADEEPEPEAMAGRDAETAPETKPTHPSATTPPAAARAGLPISGASPSSMVATSGAAATPPPVIPPLNSEPETHPRTHKVRRGENLAHIARQYGIELDDLRKANHLISKSGRGKSKIRIGQILEIPAGSTQVSVLPQESRGETPESGRVSAALGATGQPASPANAPVSPSKGLQTPELAPASGSVIDSKSLPGAEPSPPMR